MNTKSIYFSFLSLLLLMIASCNDDFLNRLPQGELTTDNALASPEEMAKYLNQFYDDAFEKHPGVVASEGIAFDDLASDNLVSTSPNTRTAGLNSISNASKLSAYNWIRNLNFMIENFNNCRGDETQIKHYQGEAYFFRAYYYFKLVKSYGDITWINKVLPPDQEAMKLARDPRTVIIDSILADLDKSTTLLLKKNNSSSMRLHRDVALAFKSKVALFEGTWQKYHKIKNTPFFTKGITDEKIKLYLEESKKASKEVIDGGNWKIYNTGNPLVDYQNLFITLDLSDNKEILLWKKYNSDDKIGHSITRYLNTAGGDMGVTLSLVDEYLTRDGRIFKGKERDDAQKIYAKELSPELRDPRLSQTVATPGTQLKPLSESSPYMPVFPPLNQGGFQKNISGYSLLKFVEYNNVKAVYAEYSSEAPAIQFRYAEILLDYAEAVAELGGDPQEIIKALQPLRDRAGMPSVDFDREYNSDSNYAFSNLSKTIQIVRRERRIELANEGKRFYDILRWAAADQLLTNVKPLGALFIGSDMEDANTKGKFFDLNGGILTYDQGNNSKLYLTGNAGDTKRYIEPYKMQLPNGYGFKIDRDYLLPIQERMLVLTGNKWINNPGW